MENVIPRIFSIWHISVLSTKDCKFTNYLAIIDGSIRKECSGILFSITI